MATKRYRNDGPEPCVFKIWGQPDMAPTEYNVAPGEECEIPSGYCNPGGFLSRRAPTLVPADTPPPPVSESFEGHPPGNDFDKPLVSPPPSPLKGLGKKKKKRGGGRR